MAVPDFQSMLLPLLKTVGDGHNHTTSQVTELLASQFALTDDDRRELLPSGMQSRFENRVGWSITYLTKAGLLERPTRGQFRITERGKEVLESGPSSLTVGFLRRFHEFRDFLRPPGQHPPGGCNRSRDCETDSTPEETLEDSYRTLRDNLAQDLLSRVKSCSPRFFERLVVDLLVAMGYGGSRHDAGQAVGRAGDEGLDGIIKEDKLGLDVIYIQAKRWQGTVGRPVVQAFSGSLDGQRAKKGVLITASQFSQEARDYVSRIEKKIVTIQVPWQPEC